MKIKAKKHILRKSSFAIFESLKGKQITTFIFFTKIRINFREATTLMSDISGFFKGGQIVEVRTISVS